MSHADKKFKMCHSKARINKFIRDMFAFTFLVLKKFIVVGDGGKTKILWVVVSPKDIQEEIYFNVIPSYMYVAF